MTTETKPQFFKACIDWQHQYCTRTFTSQLVRWCPEAGTWQPRDEPVCLWDHDTGTHRLRLRRMIVCSVADCAQAYFSKEDFDAHACYSAY